MRLMFISNQRDIAKYVQDAGVDTIFVDLEQMGKVQRQSDFDTVINHHKNSDIDHLKSVVSSAELMVRLNPLHDNSVSEINDAINRGADCLMLPMFRSVVDVQNFRDMVAGRAKVRPLIETVESLNCASELAVLDGIDSFHFGLNDLHIAFRDNFIFDPLRKKRLDRALSVFDANGVKFGIGGMARLGEGNVSGRDVLAEYVGRGSKAVILSRTFHRDVSSLVALKATMDLPSEINAIRSEISMLQQRSQEDVAREHLDFDAKVANISEKIKLKNMQTCLNR